MHVMLLGVFWCYTFVIGWDLIQYMVVFATTYKYITYKYIQMFYKVIL